MARPMFFLHRATLGLTLLLQIVVTNSLIVPAAHSVSSPPDGREGQGAVTPGSGDRVQQPEQPSPTGNSPFTDWNAFTPPQRGIPGRREGGGTRGTNCPSPITALIPESTMGRTASGQPAFFLYIPGTLDQKILEFEITDETDKTLYKTTFPLSIDRPGIVGIQWSPNSKFITLEENKNYRWYLTIKCSNGDSSNDILVSGWINPIALSADQKRQLEQTQDPLEKLKVYAQEGLWYETMATLAALRLEKSTDSTIKNQWNELLKSIGFDPNQTITQNQKNKAQAILEAPILKIQTNQ
ncbi:conserved hypothetical protein [Planktothrix serta PCC 8927]|uniref:DUF928 domain-containing protein n=1 Tax=Planktothrix serta PCC 8927 TaxID=671068 RepID=A0A7Z9BXE2_9CYAN|nr:DUF928 domain-containing protein [Planktothrix serta]VXD24455.1 conserved hypothetical protein [Planktothrix serta PCC 8927]